MRELLPSLAALALLCATPAVAGDYVQKPGSTLGFSTAYQGETFVGKLPGFVTRLHFDPARLADARLDVDIPLAGVSIDNPDGDETLKSGDFFNIAKFPRARYSASRFRALGGNRYAADGTLALRGVSKPVTLDFTFTPGANAVLSGSAKVKRLEFGVGGGEWADTDTLPNQVTITTRVLLSPASAASPSTTAKPAVAEKAPARP